MNEIGSQPIPNEKLWTKSYILVLLLGVFSSTASQMVTPLLSKYALSLGAALTFAATITSTLSIAALICRPFSGVVSDRLNRKHLMIISTFITSLCVAGYSLADNSATLMIIRICHGVSFSFMGVANMAFGSSFIPRERMGEGMGYLGLGAILSTAIGPNIGLSLSSNLGFGICFVISGCISLASVVVIFLIPYEFTKPTVKKHNKITFNSLFAKEITILVLIMGLFSCGNGLLNTYLALIGDARGIANIGLFFTAYSIVLVFIRPLTGKLLDKKGLGFILIPSLIIASLGMVLVGYANAIWMLVLAGVMKAVGQGAGSPSIQASCIKQLGRERAGVASSTCYIGMDLGNAIAPIVGGVVATSFGYGVVFYGYAAILLFGGLGLYLLHNYIEKRKKAPSLQL